MIDPTPNDGKKRSRKNATFYPRSEKSFGKRNESTSLSCVCGPAGARHRQRMSAHSTGVSLDDQACAGHSYHVNYLFILPLYYHCSSILSHVATFVFLSWNFVQLNWTFDSLIRPTLHRGGTTQHQGWNVPELGVDWPRLGRTWGGSTRGGSTVV